MTSLDPLEILLPELVEKIFSYLTATDLLSCAAVSQNWYTGTNNACLWKKLCFGKGWTSRKEYENCIEHFDCFSEEDIERIRSFDKWKTHFIIKNRLRKNWCNGKYKEGQVTLTKKAGTITCTSISNTMLALGCSNGIVELFDILQDEDQHVQTIVCTGGQYIRRISISPNYLVFSEKFLLFIFKVNEEGRYDFCSIKVISDKEVVEFTDPSAFIGGDVQMDSNNFSENADNSIDRLGVKFCMNDDILVTANIVSSSIVVWNLNAPDVEISNVFELESNCRINRIDVLDDILYATEINLQNKSTNTYQWFLKAYSLKNNCVLYRSATFLEDDLSSSENDALLQISNAYVVNIIFYDEDNQHKIHVFDAETGEILYHGFTGFIDLFPLSDNTDFVAMTQNEYLVIFNPKTDNIKIIRELQGLIIGVCNDVLVTECAEYDRFGRGNRKLEFWRLKDKDCEDPFLVLPKSYDPTGTFCETSILFIGTKSVSIFNFLA